MSKGLLLHHLKWVEMPQTTRLDFRLVHGVSFVHLLSYRGFAEGCHDCVCVHSSNWHLSLSKPAMTCHILGRRLVPTWRGIPEDQWCSSPPKKVSSRSVSFPGKHFSSTSPCRRMHGTSGLLVSIQRVANLESLAQWGTSASTKWEMCGVVRAKQLNGQPIGYKYCFECCVSPVLKQCKGTVCRFRTCHICYLANAVLRHGPLYNSTQANRGIPRHSSLGEFGLMHQVRFVPYYPCFL